MDFTSIEVRAPDEWEAWDTTNVEGSDGGVSLSRDSFPTYINPEPVVEDLPTGFRIVDIAVDPCGDLFLLLRAETRSDESLTRYGGELRRYDAAKQSYERIWCSSDDDPAFTHPTAVCVTEEDLYIANGAADDSAAGSIHVFSRRLLQRRRIVADVENPVALATDGATVYVLDTGRDSLATISPFGEVKPIEKISGGRDLAVDSDGTLYVLTCRKTGSRIERIPKGSDKSTRVGMDAPSENASCIEAVNGGRLLIGVASEDDRGEQAIFRCRFKGDSCDVVGSYREDSQRLVAISGNTEVSPGLYVLNDTGSSVYFLSEVNKRRVNSSTGQYDGVLSTYFDSGETGTRWHRVTLDFTLGDANGAEPRPETRVKVSYCATEKPKPPKGSNQAWSELRPNPRDALLNDATGRFLWLKIELLGSEYASPIVRALRVYFPHQSYLRYLPEIYSENDESREFLERFLSVFESVFTDIESEIEHITKFLDPGGVPADYLVWLGSWLALDIDRRWPEEAKRTLISEAPELFKKRGTRAGLLAVLNIYTSALQDQKRPTEESLRRSLPSRKKAADKTAIPVEDANEEFDQIANMTYLLEWSDLECIDHEAVKELFVKLMGCPQCFLVLIRPGASEEHRQTIERIVELQKPAHTNGRAVSLRPQIQLDRHTYLGINTHLLDQSLVLEESTLGADSQLVEQERDAQLDLRSRLDESFRVR